MIEVSLEKKRLFLMIFGISLLFVLSFFVEAALYEAEPHKEIIVDRWEECRRVLNTGSASLLVPTGNSLEWQEFRIHAPHITLSPCVLKVGEPCDENQQCESGHCYRDQDGDRYHAASGQKHCQSSASLGLDCNDNDATRWRLRYLDADNDGHCASSTQFCVGNHAGYRDSCLSYSDCNDNNANIYRNVANLVEDKDRDGYHIGSAATRCVGTTMSSGGRTYYRGANGQFMWLSSSSSLGIDCYDLNADARPGQTSYFTTHRGDGSFDYDCDGIETKYPHYNKQTTSSSRSCTTTPFEFSPGYTSSIPACGQSGTYRVCLEYDGTNCNCLGHAIVCPAEISGTGPMAWCAVLLASTNSGRTQDYQRVMPCR